MEIVNIILHFDKHLQNIITLFGPWTYVVLFAIVFAETGFVLTPFLPGDSLLFIVGTLAGGGYLNIFFVYIIFVVAAILGDSVNYTIGHFLGPRVFSQKNSRIFNKAYLEKTREFYAKYGGKTIVLARFVPIIRTFAPFVAGVGKMDYKTFLFYNVFGAFIWVTSLTFAGYFFGGIPLIKNNFEYAVIIIILISIVPVIVEYIKHKREKKPSYGELERATYKDLRKTFKHEHLND